MGCRDCAYYEKLNDGSLFYCEKHDDIFNELGEDDNWCTQYKESDNTLKEAYYNDVEARDYPSEPEENAVEL